MDHRRLHRRGRDRTRPVPRRGGVHDAPLGLGPPTRTSASSVRAGRWRKAPRPAATPGRLGCGPLTPAGTMRHISSAPTISRTAVVRPSGRCRGWLGADGTFCRRADVTLSLRCQNEVVLQREVGDTRQERRPGLEADLTRALPGQRAHERRRIGICPQPHSSEIFAMTYVNSMLSSSILCTPRFSYCASFR